MICLRCGGKSKENYCNGCFTRIVEKRVKKAIRESGLLEKGLVLVASDEFVEGLLRKIINLPVTITSIAQKGKNVLPCIGSTIDDQSVAFLEEYIGDRKEKNVDERKAEKLKKRELNLFSCLSDAEVVRYFTLSGKKFIPKEHPLKKHLDVLIKKYPEVQYALHNATNEYDHLLEKGI
jgi:hypothetical protein